MIHRSMDKKKKKKKKKSMDGFIHALMPCVPSQVNDAAAGCAEGTCNDRSAHELLLRAHRRRPAVVGGRARAGRHPEVLLLVHLPQPLDFLLQRLLMSCGPK